MLGSSDQNVSESISALELSSCSIFLNEFCVVVCPTISVNIDITYLTPLFRLDFWVDVCWVQTSTSCKLVMENLPDFVPKHPGSEE